MTTAYFSHPDCRLHDMGAGHPECPQRLDAIEDQLLSSGVDVALTRFDVPLAAHSDLLLAHTEGYLTELEEFIRQAIETGEHRALDPDTYVGPHTWQAALRSAGAAVAATDAVIDGRAENAFCAIRPPGHHATRSQSMGFCFFNNIAVAARHALDVRGLKRVAIVDFDVHHGNGTEAAFHDEPRVMMCSIFQHPFYPYSGTETVTANMVNIPLPAYTNGLTVREVVETIWLPRLEAFRPEMLFISAGFDAHREDDLGQMGLVEADYAWITQQLMQVARTHAGGRIVSCLEGGYNLSALGRSVVAHIKALAEL